MQNRWPLGTWGLLSPWPALFEEMNWLYFHSNSNKVSPSSSVGRSQAQRTVDLTQLEAIVQLKWKMTAAYWIFTRCQPCSKPSLTPSPPEPIWDPGKKGLWSGPCMHAWVYLYIFYPLHSGPLQSVPLPVVRTFWANGYVHLELTSPLLDHTRGAQTSECPAYRLHTPLSWICPLKVGCPTSKCSQV